MTFSMYQPARKPLADTTYIWQHDYLKLVHTLAYKQLVQRPKTAFIYFLSGCQNFRREKNYTQAIFFRDGRRGHE